MFTPVSRHRFALCARLVELTVGLESKDREGTIGYAATNLLMPSTAWGIIIGRYSRFKVDNITTRLLSIDADLMAAL